MKTFENKYWVYYSTEPSERKKTDLLTYKNCGKWMYFTKNFERAAELCKKAVEDGVVCDTKHSRKLRKSFDRCVCCFYLNADDLEGHKRVIQFFLDNNLIPKNIDGKLHNISFKPDTQTMSERKGIEKIFEPSITLDQFLDLYTGEWKV